KTATKLIVEHKMRGMGGMWYGLELPLNPASEKECKARDAKKLPKVWDFEEDIPDQKHTVTVGDVCFVAIGMISNRAYSAVRYQPTACIVVNSTTQQPKLAAAVRDMWTAPDAHEELFRRLLDDFYTSDERRFAPGAAMRLLYYFPKEAAPIIIERLTKYEAKMGKNDNYELVDLLEAIAWCEDEKIIQKIRAIAKASDDDSVIAAATPAMRGGGDARYFEKLNTMLLKANSGKQYPTTTVQDLLAAISEVFPDKLEGSLQAYLDSNDHESALNAVRFLSEKRTDLAPRLLVQMLNDKRPGLGSYRKDGKDEPPDDNDEVIEMRLCDDAWWLINVAQGNKTIRCEGGHGEMDKRIEEFKKTLKAQPSQRN
ncbi:MAG TPA: hypothetical protein VEJ63_00445, partial [Planctomycetota bacterium]|nr:hypothetical protein [Planctomycetota bacterium]